MWVLPKSIISGFRALKNFSSTNHYTLFLQPTSAIISIHHTPADPLEQDNRVFPRFNPAIPTNCRATEKFSQRNVTAMDDSLAVNACQLMGKSGFSRETRISPLKILLTQSVSVILFSHHRTFLILSPESLKACGD